MIATTAVALVVSKVGHNGRGITVGRLLGPGVLPVWATCPLPVVPILATQSQWRFMRTGGADQTGSVLFLLLLKNFFLDRVLSIQITFECLVGLGSRRRRF